MQVETEEIKKSEKQETVALAPVVSGKAAVKKKSEGKKFLDAFFEGDVNNLGASIISNVVIPAVRDLIWNSVERAVKGLLYGDFSSSRGSDRNSIPARQVDFTRYSDRRRRDRDDYRDSSRDDIYDYGEIFLEDRRDADAIVDRVFELLDRYQWVSVAQLYELAGLRGRYTDHNYGWRDRDRNSIYVTTTRGGYLVKMPRPRPLD